MRPEMRHLLTPRMIQSMEILQLPLMALEERIEQELQNNPVLEQLDPDGSEGDGDFSLENKAPAQERAEGETSLVVKDDNSADDFERLEKISEYFENEEFHTNGSQFRVANNDGERDKKQDALNNTAARGENLAEHLLDQWTFVEAGPDVKRAGEAIINYINSEGYLATDLETIRNELKTPLPLEALIEALRLIPGRTPLLRPRGG